MTQTLSHLAFTDGVVLMAETPRGLQEQITRFMEHLERSSLCMNASECVTIAINAVPAKKSWVSERRKIID